MTQDVTSPAPPSPVPPLPPDATRVERWAHRYFVRCHALARQLSRARRARR